MNATLQEISILDVDGDSASLVATPEGIQAFFVSNSPITDPLDHSHSARLGLSSQSLALLDITELSAGTHARWQASYAVVGSANVGQAVVRVLEKGLLQEPQPGAASLVYALEEKDVSTKIRLGLDKVQAEWHDPEFRAVVSVDPLDGVALWADATGASALGDVDARSIARALFAGQGWPSTEFEHYRQERPTLRCT